MRRQGDTKSVRGNSEGSGMMMSIVLFQSSKSKVDLGGTDRKVE